MAVSDKLIIFLALMVLVTSNPYDDGKYNPKKYRILDDGKYYRPLTEGKYKPGDEGRYTYVYKQGLYPTDDGDYRYVHQDGQDESFRESAGIPIRGDESNKIEYIGHKTYAGRYPYIHKVIKALEDEYVSTDSIFGKMYGKSGNHHTNVQGENEVALKCKPLKPLKSESKQSVFVTQYPPRSHVEDGENVGSFYTFKGTKTISTLSTPLFTTKLKLQYEVFIRVLDEITEVKDEDYLQQENDDFHTHTKKTKQRNQNSQESSVHVPLKKIFDAFILQNEKPKEILLNKQNIIYQKKIAIADPKNEFLSLQSRFRVIEPDGVEETKAKQSVEENKNKLKESSKNYVIDDNISPVVLNATNSYEPSKEIELPYETNAEKNGTTRNITPTTTSEKFTFVPTTEVNQGASNMSEQFDRRKPTNGDKDFTIANVTEGINFNEFNTEQPTTENGDLYEDYSTTSITDEYDIEQFDITTQRDQMMR